jgi:hypothetical protein
MNAQMAKHCVDPPASMFFEGTEMTTSCTRSNFRDEGANRILGNFRLDPPDQVFAIVMSETEVGLGRQFGPLHVGHCG